MMKPWPGQSGVNRKSMYGQWKALSGRTTIDLRKLMSVGIGGSWPEKKGHTWPG